MRQGQEGGRAHFLGEAEESLQGAALPPPASAASLRLAAALARPSAAKPPPKQTHVGQKVPTAPAQPNNSPLSERLNKGDFAVKKAPQGF